MATKIILKNVRLSYCEIFEPVLRSKEKPEDGYYYKTALLFPKDHPQIAELKAAVVAEAKAKFGDKWKAVLANNDPIKDPEKKAIADGLKLDEPPEEVSPELKGMLMINASCSTKRKPQVVDQKLEKIFSGDEVYSGCWANVSVATFGFDRDKNKGVSFGLNNVQLVRTDDRLGGAADAGSDFESIEGGSSGASDDDDYSID
jgi:hypothetical protein